MLGSRSTRVVIVITVNLAINIVVLIFGLNLGNHNLVHPHLSLTAHAAREAAIPIANECHRMDMSSKLFLKREIGTRRASVLSVTGEAALKNFGHSFVD
ncbi:hypothetical protein FocTR4_00002272, partial [Fusarium oxysporum f. sp. cubense]